LSCQIEEGEQQLQQVTVAQSVAAAAATDVELNPFLEMDTKCFFPGGPFATLDMKCFFPGSLQMLEAQQRQMLATELNLGYQLAPPDTDVANNNPQQF
jgi:MADS-box transcription factor, plant